MPSCAALVRCRFLDPRPAAEARVRPIADAVNIPLAELPARMHELPPRAAEILVVGEPPLVNEAVAWLQRHERRAAAVRGKYAERAGDAHRAAGQQGPAPIGRLWEPNAFLAEVLPALPVGRALDLACGTGRDAVYMAAAGWDVVAIDRLPDALERARELRVRYPAGAGAVEWRVADLEDPALSIGAEFDLIVMFRYLHRPLLARLPGWLRPGGSIVLATFTTRHRARHGRPESDERVVRANELPAYFTGLEVCHYSEAWHGTDHMVRLWARAASDGVAGSGRR